MVNITGHGFNVHATNYTCHFPGSSHEVPPNGTVDVSSATMVPKADLWTPTVILCRTPNWGRLYPSMTTRMSVFELQTELEFRGQGGLPEFRWTEARWVTVAADNQVGAPLPPSLPLGCQFFYFNLLLAHVSVLDPPAHSIFRFAPLVPPCLLGASTTATPNPHRLPSTARQAGTHSRLPGRVWTRRSPTCTSASSGTWPPG